MEEISTDDAPASIGPYSQGTISGDKIFVSGQGPVDPDTGEIVGETPAEQTEHTLDNIAAILEAAGASTDDIVNATVYLRDMDHYDEVNEVYGDYLSEPYPARAAVGVRELPIDIHVEIQVIAER